MSTEINTFLSRISHDPIGCELWKGIKEAFALPQNPTPRDLLDAMNGKGPPISETRRHQVMCAIAWLNGSLEEHGIPCTLTPHPSGTFKVEVHWDD